MSTLPPGPTAPPPAQTIAYHRDPLGALRRARATYGPVFTLRFMASGPAVVIADPDAVARLLESDGDGARAGEARRRVLPFASPWSTFGGDGSDHREARRRVAAAFSAETLARRDAGLARLARGHAARWPRNRPFRLLPRIRTLIDEAFLDRVLGVRDDALLAGLVIAVRRMLLSPGNPPVPLPGEGNETAPALGAALFDARRMPVTRLLERAIDARRDDPDGDDVIAVLLRDDPQRSAAAMADELLPVLMAGQEPPSIALTWLLDRLGRHRDVRSHFLSAPAEDPYRDAVVRETLRLHPPAQAALRLLTAPFEAGGTTVPEGATVMLPIPLLHRDPRAFPQPDEFRPERWLGGAQDESCYLPFGGGVRRCLGEHVARAYFRALLPALLESVRVRPLRPRPERMVVRATTLVPHRSLLAVAR